MYSPFIHSGKATNDNKKINLDKATWGPQPSLNRHNTSSLWLDPLPGTTLGWRRASCSFDADVSTNPVVVFAI